MKKCSVCGETKDFEFFGKRKNRPDGHRSECKSCQSIYRKRHFEANKEKQLEQGRRWKTENREKVLEYSKSYAKEHKDVRNALQSKRHAKKVSSSIMEGDEWNDLFIDEIYNLRKVRSEETGIEWHVDHIVPLQGKIVSGLHVWYNLQCIPARLNLIKKNSF